MRSAKDLFGLVIFFVFIICLITGDDLEKFS